MSKWQPIVDELNSDPATYGPLDHAAAAAAIMAKTEAVSAGEIDPYQIDKVVPVTERTALKTEHPALYDKWQAILAHGRTVDVGGSEMQGLLTFIGPVGSGGTGTFSQATVDAINALATTTRPVAQAWGLGNIDAWKVSKARKEMV